MSKKNVKMTVTIDLEIPDSIKADNLFADLAALQLYQKKGKDERVYVGNGIKVVEFKTVSVEYAPGQKPIPEKLAALVEKYAVHEDILKQVRLGNLEFNEHLEEKDHLEFLIPELDERKASAILYWYGPDPKTWSLHAGSNLEMGGMRFYAEMSYEDGDSSELWSPEEGNEEDEPQTKEDHEANVDDFVCWLENKD